MNHHAFRAALTVVVERKPTNGKIQMLKLKSAIEHAVTVGVRAGESKHSLTKRFARDMVPHLKIVRMIQKAKRRYAPGSAAVKICENLVVQQARVLIGDSAFARRKDLVVDNEMIKNDSGTSLKSEVIWTEYFLVTDLHDLAGGVGVDEDQAWKSYCGHVFSWWSLIETYGAAAVAKASAPSSAKK